MKNNHIIDFDFLDQCKTISKEYEKLKGRWTAESQVLHIIKEVCEFDIELRKGTPETVLEEYADIMLTTIATGNFFGLTNQQINDALIAKLAIVKQRVKDA